MQNSNELKDLTRLVSGIINEAEKKKLDKPGEEDADIDNDGDTDSSDKYLAARRKAITKDVKADAKKDKEVNEAEKKKLDKPGEEDADIDNDGDTDSSDKYLAARRKAITKDVKADAKKDKEVKEDTAQFHMVKLALYPVASHTDKQIREFLSQRDGELSESTIFDVVAEFDAFIAEAAKDKHSALVQQAFDLDREAGFLNDWSEFDAMSMRKLKDYIKFAQGEVKAFAKSKKNESVLPEAVGGWFAKDAGKGDPKLEAKNKAKIAKLVKKIVAINSRRGGDAKANHKLAQDAEELNYEIRQLRGFNEAKDDEVKVGDEYYHDEKWRKVTAATKKNVTLDVDGKKVVIPREDL